MNELQTWVLEALKANGGRGSVIEVSKHIWENHENDLRGSGDLFYKWQYDIRWAAMQLRKHGKMTPANKSGVWMLK